MKTDGQEGAPRVKMLKALEKGSMITIIKHFKICLGKNNLFRLTIQKQNHGEDNITNESTNNKDQLPISYAGGGILPK